MLRLPPGMARPSIPRNPSPALITAEMWEFAHLVISLERNDFVFAGIYADKSGYHNTVTANLRKWPNTYSVRLAADLNGDRTKARALDIKSKQAASGAAPTIMARYGARMRAAAKARDPRVRHWREVLGQFDTDRAPEAIDFQSLSERQPDSTHEWHIHWSILAMYVALALAYEGMLSVLYGESLASWNRYSGKGETDMDVMFAMDGEGQIYRVEGGQSYPISDPDNLKHAVYVIEQRGGSVASGPVGDEWTRVNGFPVRLGWGADAMGPVAPAGVDVGALAAAIRASLGALDLGLDSDDVERIVAALREAPDVPFGERDQPVIEAALRRVLRSGTDDA